METILSPTIKKLKQQIDNGDTGTLKEFWSKIELEGSPLVETIPDDQEHVLVTAVWKDAGDIKTIAVFGELFGLDSEKTKMERLEGSELWFRTCIAPIDARSLYVFFINEPANAEISEIDVRLDPYNPHVITCVEDEMHPNDYCVSFKQENMVELPGFKNSPYVELHEGTAHGSVQRHDFESSLSNRSYRVWVYKPANYELLQSPCGLAIFMDGWEYLHETKTAVILDNMIESRIIPPLVAVFIDNKVNREEDLRMNPVYTAFLTEELLPWVKNSCNISNNPEQTLIGGFSAGGVSASYAALLHPEIFGKVLSQSGAFYWASSTSSTKENILELYKKEDKLPVEFYLSIGEFEKFEEHLGANLSFYDILKNKGYNVIYEEFKGGHTNFDCQLTLSKGLEFLMKKS